MKKAKRQRDRRVEEREAHRLALARRPSPRTPRLHDRRVQIQVVRHHRRAEDADGDVEHLAVGDDVRGRHEALRPRRRRRARARTISNRKHRPTDAMSVMTSASRTRTPRFCSASSSRTSKPVTSTPTASGMMEQQVQRDRRADDLGQVARGDGDLAEDPERDGDRLRVVVAARLREIAAGDDAELRREALEEHRHDVREQHDAEQRVAEARSAGEIGGPVAGVHVADRDEIPGSGEGEELPEEAPARRSGRCGRPPAGSARRASGASRGRGAAAGRRRAAAVRGEGGGGGPVD